MRNLIRRIGAGAFLIDNHAGNDQLRQRMRLSIWKIMQFIMKGEGKCLLEWRLSYLHRHVSNYPKEIHQNHP